MLWKNSIYFINQQQKEKNQSKLCFLIWWRSLTRRVEQIAGDIVIIFFKYVWNTQTVDKAKSADRMHAVAEDVHSYVYADVAAIKAF